MADKKKWQCPACGKKKYKDIGYSGEVFRDLSMGFSNPKQFNERQILYSCKSCSVVFSNPKKFNNNKKE